jgi:hypothetical protein
MNVAILHYIFLPQSRGHIILFLMIHFRSISRMLGPLSSSTEVSMKSPQPPLRAQEVLTRLRAIRALRGAGSVNDDKPEPSDAQLIALAYRGYDLVYSIPVFPAPMGSPS